MVNETVQSEPHSVVYGINVYTWNRRKKCAVLIDTRIVDDPLKGMRFVADHFKERTWFGWKNRREYSVFYITCVSEDGHEQWRLQIS